MLFKHILRNLKNNRCSKTTLRFYRNEQVRVRFAPSPTGYLHLGGLRTALYNYLYAKKYDGVFILRIEDTDQSRTIPGAAETLKDDLTWAGIHINEGPWQGGHFRPYVQSERLDLYKDHINILLNNGTAYHCFCTERRLQLLRKEALKAQQIPRYDNKCRNLTQDEVKSRIARGDKYCIRFKISDTEESFNDLIYGKISYNISLNEGDPIIIKTDGYPTYHFANVVDDHLMNITHVFRGVEWQISTTKHLMMYRAFGWNAPNFGHLPLLLNADGTKLSKRQGDIKISFYRDNYIFPLALINYITHSGGGFQKDQEQNVKPKCHTIDELCHQFDVSRINSHSGKLMSDMLLEFNNLELKRQFEDEDSRKKLVPIVRDLLHKTYSDRVDLLQTSDDYIIKILQWSLTRTHKLSDLFTKNLEFIWFQPSSVNIEKNITKALVVLKIQLANEEDLNKDKISVILKRVSKENNLKYSSFMKDLRLILSGLKEGPSVAEMMDILGKEDSIRRISLCLNKYESVK
ncbi:hypothetical protein GWI33_022426 [Rhynchophorus ferrugineus]|uniref:Nondiscriminating glutamyl-tRNA synthetase EARS2, mitochondrial n=1 Tax=Rhynchophorus ferrugineus TaxID=354439 RepID=A0A834ML57_RHYFE|nr:hypothetical protein GWI33_022426 [Rhynchophorus ferrugineus]